MPLIRHRRAPCGARQSDHSEGGITFISTHAPFAGRDSEAMTAAQTLERFQPKRPLRGATRAEGIQPSEACISIHAPLAGRDTETAGLTDKQAISIHAPLAGRDLPGLDCKYHARYFNPRAPCGARPSEDGGEPYWGRISIHAPLAGRDHADSFVSNSVPISIHAPLAGRDSSPRKTPSN